MARTGQGVTLTFATSAFSAEVTNVPIAISRGVLDSTHHGTTVGRDKLPTTLYDAGESAIEIFFEPSETPPIAAVAETVTISWPIKTGHSTATTWACTGFASNFEGATPVDELMTGTLTMTWSGAYTWTEGAV